MEIVWSALAVRDLSDIALYISDKFGDSVSEKSINKIVQKVERLRRFPKIGTLDRSYSTSAFSVHYIIFPPNVIYYLLEKDTIVIMTVIHVKRSQSYVNKRLECFFEDFEP